MKLKISSVIFHGSIFAWLALATTVLLSIPLLVMFFSSEVSWGAGDFAVMGALLFGFGSLFVLIARRVQPAMWGFVALALLGGFMFLWVELAVGVFTNLGS